MQILKDLAAYQPDNLTDFQQFLFWILVLAILALWCFIDIIGYLITSYLVKYTEVEKKYPKLSHIIKYYENTSIIFLVIEIIFVILTLIIVIAICVHLLYLTNEN